MDKKTQLQELIKQFSSSLGFVSVDAMKAVGNMYHEQHLANNCKACKNLEEESSNQSSSEDLAADLSKINISQKGNLNKSSRKSRKSVCALPRIMSSSESSEDENNLEAENSTSGDEQNVVDESIESPMFTHKKIPSKTQNIVSSDEDEIELSVYHSNSDKDEASSSMDDSYSASDEFITSDGESEIVKQISKINLSTNQNSPENSLKENSKLECISPSVLSPTKTIGDHTSNKSSEEEDITIPDSLSNSNNNIKKSKKQIISSSSDEEEDFFVSRKRNKNKILDDSESSNTENEFLEPVKATLFKDEITRSSSIEDCDIQETKNDNKNQIKQFLISSDESGDYDDEDGDESNNSLDDFIVDDDISNDDDLVEIPQFKTPKPVSSTHRKVLSEQKYKNLQTPKSISRNVLNRIQAPNSQPGTPAYKREFNRTRDKAVQDLFKLFNTTIFDNKLSPDMSITWNKRLTKTAGFCYYNSQSTEKCRIELSDKVIDCLERLRDTLIHELCHAATWVINNTKNAGHGPVWKYWAKKANQVHSDLPIISRCHQYVIQTKFNYQCNGCSKMFGRHSKSIDPTRHRCSRCGGIPELLSNHSSTSSTPRTPNAYAMFLKHNFASVKKSNPGIPHKELMQLISAKFRDSKKTENNKEN